MKIYIMNSTDDNFDMFESVIKISLDDVRTFDGRSKSVHWTPMAIQRMNNGDSNLPIADATAFNSIPLPIFNKKALDALCQVIENDCEVLELFSGENSPYYGINVTTVVDAIDYAKAEYKAFSSGRAMTFLKYAFVAEGIQKHNIFRIKEVPRKILVSDTFVSMVEKHKLSGFVFKEVWNSEE